MVLMKANLTVPLLDLDLDKKLVLHLVQLMMLWTEIKIILGVTLVHLMDLLLALMKASYSASLMVNWLALNLELQMISHLGMIKELISVIQMDPLLVLMKELYWVLPVVI